MPTVLPDLHPPISVRAAWIERIWRGIATAAGACLLAGGVYMAVVWAGLAREWTIAGRPLQWHRLHLLATAGSLTVTHLVLGGAVLARVAHAPWPAAALCLFLSVASPFAPVLGTEIVPALSLPLVVLAGVVDVVLRFQRIPVGGRRRATPHADDDDFRGEVMDGLDAMASVWRKEPPPFRAPRRSIRRPQR